MGNLYHIPPLKARGSKEKGGKKTVRARGRERLKEMVLSQHNRIDTAHLNLRDSGSMHKTYISPSQTKCQQREEVNMKSHP